MWRGERVLASTASSSRCRRATCCRSRTPTRTRRCGSRPATRARSRRRRGWASACCASRPGHPRRSQPLIELYKKTIENAEPVGEYVNNNIMVTSQMLCLEDGQKARDITCNMTSRLPEQPRVPLPRHVPEARGAARLAGPDPRADARGSTRPSSSDLVCIGTPDEVIPSVQRLRRRRRRPAGVRHAVDDDADRDRDRGGRDVRQARDPRVRQGPGALHDPPARGVRRQAGPRKKTTLGHVYPTVPYV